MKRTPPPSRHATLKDLGLPEVALLRWHNPRAASTGIQGEAGPWHEFLFVRSGRHPVAPPGAAAVHLLGSGEMFAARPGEAAGSGGWPAERCLLYRLRLRLPAKGRGFLGLSARESAGLLAALDNLPRRHFKAADDAGAQLDRLLDLAGAGASPLAPVEARTLILSFLLDAVRQSRQALRPRDKRVEAALKFLFTHRTRPVAVAEMAKVAGVSEPHFKVLFKRETGQPPAEHALRLRFWEARRRLLENPELPIGVVAREMGFPSSQYFHAVWKRFRDATPAKERAFAAEAGGAGTEVLEAFGA